MVLRLFELPFEIGRGELEFVMGLFVSFEVCPNFNLKKLNRTTSSCPAACTGGTKTRLSGKCVDGTACVSIAQKSSQWKGLYHVAKFPIDDFCCERWFHHVDSINPSIECPRSVMQVQCSLLR